MKKVRTVILLTAILMMSSMFLVIPTMAKKEEGTRIQDGVLTYSTGHYLEGEPLVLGFDPYGYNYQGHMFVGSYANAYLGRYGFPEYEGSDSVFLQRCADEEITGTPAAWYWDYRDVKLMMKWNDAWLSNMDCDEDGALDRLVTGAWLTNHQSGTDEGEHWTYFVKIVTAPEDAYVDGELWYSVENVEIGPVIWGAFAIIQQIEQGVVYHSPSPVGFGYYKP